MKLAIDTSRIRWASVTKGAVGKTGESLLPLIEELGISDVTEIEVNSGPGSFTGLRVGAAVANALGYLLDVPVNGKKTIVIPKYS